MRGYSYFADYYDRLTQNISYGQLAEYLCRLLQKLGHDPGIVLDLACGTGSLTLDLAQKGIDVYGVDASPEMLSIAQQKAAQQNQQVLFLCQKMQDLDLYGTVDTVLCTLDSVNHMVQEKDIQAAFQKVSLFLYPGGYFIFDVNTVYKHREILGDHTFVYDLEDIFCVWQNTFYPDTNKVRIHLDFFEREDAVYYRRQEEFLERAYTNGQITGWLQNAGLTLVDQYDGFTFDSPGDTAERIVYVARK